ncbi:BglG family transcription antiterminator [Geomicrobium sp. JCM 19039]|uniref:BglG family transcription antiterminator n=1 Tax=Geomicrobium sp. JCM 19039 TaxID=1460636 RepID=UPI00045F2B58|nr:BglG family transcription antiterminator [Geomicrobium sp. JCM 19039]GAK14326.1 mannitol operon activator, BglG family [Geomicrobium sp. JCM 19039]
MHMTARERILLTTLVTAGDPVGLSRLAEDASVSLRTIQRDLKALERTVQPFGLTLIRNRDRTVFLQGNLEALRTYLQSMSSADFTSEERQGVLLVQLLTAGEPVKLFTLSHHLGVTASTVSSDLDKTAEWLNEYGLSLIRRRGYGIEVEGSETNKRRALSGILSSRLTEETLFAAVHDEQMEEKVTERLLHVVDIGRVKRVLGAVRSVKAEHFPHMVDQSLIALVVHTTLAIERLGMGEAIQMDTDQLEALEQTDEYVHAYELGLALQDEFDISLPREEFGYLVMHLRGARVGGMPDQPFEESNGELISRIKRLISGVEDALGVQFHEHVLLQDLLAHLKPALYRIRQDMKITNPLLERLRGDYSDLFQAVDREANRVFEPLHIPNEEIGFLVLHFGSVLERRKRWQELSALVICPSGIGSAKMLASRLQQEFPEIAKIENASMFDLNEATGKVYDLIISTVNMEMNNEQVFHVSPVLTESEVQTIRHYIDNTLLTVGRDVRKPQPKGNVPFAQYADLATVMFHVTGSFTIFQAKDVESGLWQNAEQLEREGSIANAVRWVEALNARESKGGLAIPGTGLALYHARDEAVLHPSLQAFDLEQETSLRSMGDEEERVNRVYVMVAPLHMSQSDLRFMSFLSTLFIDSPEQTEHLRIGSQFELKKWLEEACREYLAEAIAKGDESP